MFDLDRWNEIMHVLKSNKVRTFLTAFGVFWGIFMLIIMLGAGHGLERGIMGGWGDFATNSIWFRSNCTSMSYKGYKKGRWLTFKNDDMSAIKNWFKDDVKYVSPTVYVGSWNEGSKSNTVEHGLKKATYTIIGAMPEENLVEPKIIESGRFINDIDVQNNRKVAVIGSRPKDFLFKNNENPLGQYIKIAGVFFQVVGTFKTANDNDQWHQSIIYTPITTLQRAYNMGERIDDFVVTAKDDVPAADLEKKILKPLKEKHFVAPEDEQAIVHFNIAEQFNKMHGLFIGISSLFWIVGIGTLFSGVVGVSNIMLIVVKERTKEIGIQRAIGATPRRINGQIMSEALFLTSIAGFIGLIAGVNLLEAINKMLPPNGPENMPFEDPTVSIYIAMAALMVLILSGLLAGYIPAKQAIKIKTIDALRDE
jgi:putative ABC transport system permease protein